jgi:hypothetical protein
VGLTGIGMPDRRPGQRPLGLAPSTDGVARHSPLGRLLRFGLIEGRSTPADNYAAYDPHLGMACTYITFDILSAPERKRAISSFRAQHHEVDDDIAGGGQARPTP